MTLHIAPSYISPELEQAAASTRTEGETRAQIAARHAAELNRLIRRADEAFAVKVESARQRYASLLRSLPWDFQVERRNHEFILYCEELIGEGVGESMAWEIMCRERIT